MRRSTSPAKLQILFAAAVSCLCLSNPSSAVTATIPTAGLAVTSAFVGGGGVLGGALYSGQPWWYRGLLCVGGAGLVVVDPPAATYLSGRSVIDYPEHLLRFSQIVWFGEFAENPSLPGPPVGKTSGLYEEDFSFELQGPNPALKVTVEDIDGVLTVSWNAEPDGIAVDTADHVNIFGLLFDNVTDQNLLFSVTDPAMANLGQNPELQSLTCIPPGDKEPRGCGSNDEVVGFYVNAVPVNNGPTGSGSACATANNATK